MSGEIGRGVGVFPPSLSGGRQRSAATGTNTSFFDGVNARLLGTGGPSATAVTVSGESFAVSGDIASKRPLADFSARSVGAGEFAEKYTSVPARQGKSDFSMVRQGRKILDVFVGAFRSLAGLAGISESALPSCLLAGNVSYVNDLAHACGQIDAQLSDITSRNTLILLACLLDEHHRDGRQAASRYLSPSAGEFFMSSVSGLRQDYGECIRNVVYEDDGGRTRQVKDIEMRLSTAVRKGLENPAVLDRDTATDDGRPVNIRKLRAELEENNKRSLLACLTHADELKDAVRGIIKDFNEDVLADVILPEAEEGDPEKAESCEKWLVDNQPMLRGTLDQIDDLVSHGIAEAISLSHLGGQSGSTVKDTPAAREQSRKEWLDSYDGSLEKISEFARLSSEWEIINLSDIVP